MGVGGFVLGQVLGGDDADTSTVGETVSSDTVAAPEVSDDESSASEVEEAESSGETTTTAVETSAEPVSYTHLTLPTTPYV